MELVVLNTSGQETKKINLNDQIFAIEPNDHAIYLDVKQYLANKRQGTHKAKERAEVSRTTKKFKKQKGTGSARAGSLKSPLFKGGGTVFGPRPRKYSFKLNKKLKQLARRSALSYKVQASDLLVIEDFNFVTAKTKNYTELLNSLSISDKKTLLVLSETNKNVYLSARNLTNTKVLTVNELNTYEILNANKLILAEGAIEKIENNLI